jgi:hypothetical protein
MAAFTGEAYERVMDILDDLSRTGRHLQPAHCATWWRWRFRQRPTQGA